MSTRLSVQDRRSALFAGVALLIAATTLYLLTLDNGLRLDELKGGDLITHQYAQAEARPSNAPGYPLYTMGGWLWFNLGRVLLGNWLNPVQVLSLYSTIWALAALAILYLLILEVTDGNWVLGLLGGSFFSVTYFFWYYAVTAEEYTSAVFQTLLIILWAFRWDKSRADRYLLYMALMAGICLAHLPTVLFIMPPLILFLLTVQPGLLRRGRLIAQGVGLALVPLLSYAYVYIRGAQHPEWRGAGQWPSAWAWFISFLSTQQGRDELTWWIGPFTAEYPWLMARELTWVVLLVGLFGLALPGWRRALFLYSTLLIYMGFCYVDRYGNWYQVIMPMYPVLVLGFVTVADRLWKGASISDVGVRQRLAHKWVVRGLIVAAMVILIVNRFVVHYPRANQRDRPDDNALVAGWTILADNPPQGAAIIGTYDERVSLDYLVHVWQARPDLLAAGPEQMGTLLTQEDRPLYTTRLGVDTLPSEELAGLHLSSHGATLIALRRSPLMTPPPIQQRVGADIGGSLRLLGVDVLSGREERRGAASPVLHLALYWQALAKIDRDYIISVRPTYGGQPIIERVSESTSQRMVQQDHPPVWGAYPTERWTPGEVVRDDYAIGLPAGQVADGLWVVVYRALVGGGFEVLGEARFPVTWRQ
jgi:hypothetical protein